MIEPDIWSDEIKLGLFDSPDVACLIKEQRAVQPKELYPIVKYSDKSIKLWNWESCQGVRNYEERRT